MTLHAVAPEEIAEIKVGTDLQRMTDEAIGALARDAGTFQRAGQLVGVVTVPEGPQPNSRSIIRSAGAPVIRGLVPPTVRERLSSNARWVKFDARRKMFVSALPPEAVVSAACARGEWAGIRALTSAVTSPCLRPDGTVLQTPGYDASTGTLYWPREAYEPVAHEPSKEAIAAAVASLAEVVCDFPFANAAHRSAWLAGLLTLLARPAIDGPCPMFAVDATTRGTGKSRLVDAAVRLATGTNAARTSLPDDDEEMRKRITSLMCEGDPAVCLDNITKPIAMPSLDAVLTATSWKDRLLGLNTNVTVPARAVWWATGNNIALGGDISRRALHIRLESPLENPEERTDFKHVRLLEWISKARSKLVCAALTVLRGYAVAKFPDMGAPTWGSFEEWSRLIANCIRWAGLPCPLDARATRSDDAEPEKQAVGALLHTMRDILAATGERSLPARDYLRHIYEEDEHSDVRESVDLIACGRTGKPPTALQLSGAFRRLRGRVIDGFKILPVSQELKTVRWTVLAAGPAPVRPIVGPQAPEPSSSEQAP